MKKNSSQALLSYAIIIGVVVGVLISMAGYIKRRVQGSYKEAGEVFFNVPGGISIPYGDSGSTPSHGDGTTITGGTLLPGVTIERSVTPREQQGSSTPSSQ